MIYVGNIVVNVDLVFVDFNPVVGRDDLMSGYGPEIVRNVACRR